MILQGWLHHWDILETTQKAFVKDKTVELVQIDLVGHFLFSWSFYFSRVNLYRRERRTEKRKKSIQSQGSRSPVEPVFSDSHPRDWPTLCDADITEPQKGSKQEEAAQCEPAGQLRQSKSLPPQGLDAG